MKTGFLEQFNVKRVSGWVRKDLENREIIIEIGDFRFNCKATIYREDLQSNALGFSYELPSDIFEDNTRIHKVAVTIEGIGQISNSPQAIVVASSEKDKVLYGKNGWLFLKNDSNQTLDYLSGKLKLTEKTKEKWLEVLENRHRLIESINKEFIHFICPEKEVVYENELPEGVKISESRPVLGIINSLNGKTKDRVIYPKLSCKRHLTYTKGDTHWSYHGAYEAFEMIMNKLNSYDKKINYYEISDYCFTTEYQASDLLIKTNSVNIEPIQFTKSIGNPNLTFNNELQTSGRIQIYSNPKALNDAKMYILHTSSIDWMKPYINDSFSEVKYVWGRNLDLNEDLSDYDFIITQNNERFLNEPPTS